MLKLLKEIETKILKNSPQKPQKPQLQKQKTIGPSDLQKMFKPRNQSQKYDIKQKAPWMDALRAVETIKEVPELIEVDENFNND